MRTEATKGKVSSLDDNVKAILAMVMEMDDQMKQAEAWRPTVDHTLIGLKQVTEDLKLRVSCLEGMPPGLPYSTTPRAEGHCE